MSLQNTATAHAKQSGWGDTELDEMCKSYFPELDPAIVINEAIAMRMYVLKNQDLFMLPKDPKDATKGVELVLTGPGFSLRRISSDRMCAPNRFLAFSILQTT